MKRIFVITNIANKKGGQSNGLRRENDIRGWGVKSTPNSMVQTFLFLKKENLKTKKKKIEKRKKIKNCVLCIVV